MKIDDTLPIAPLQGEAGGKKPEPEAPAAGEADKVEISPAGSLLAKAQQVIYDSPEIRADKVAKVKEAVENGTYTIDTAKVADSLIAHALTEGKKKDEGK